MATFMIERTGKTRCFRMEGDLTAAVVPEIRTALQSELSEDTREIIFDLGKTLMLDSSGIGLLIATHNSLARKQGQIQVVNASPEIQKLLQSMRLTERLHVGGKPGAEVRHG